MLSASRGNTVCVELACSARAVRRDAGTLGQGRALHIPCSMSITKGCAHITHIIISMEEFDWNHTLSSSSRGRWLGSLAVDMGHGGLTNCNPHAVGATGVPLTKTMRAIRDTELGRMHDVARKVG